MIGRTHRMNAVAILLILGLMTLLVAADSGDRGGG